MIIYVYMYSSFNRIKFKFKSYLKEPGICKKASETQRRVYCSNRDYSVLEGVEQWSSPSENVRAIIPRQTHTHNKASYRQNPKTALGSQAMMPWLPTCRRGFSGQIMTPRLVAQTELMLTNGRNCRHMNRKIGVFVHGYGSIICNFYPGHSMCQKLLIICRLAVKKDKCSVSHKYNFGTFAHTSYIRGLIVRISVLCISMVFENKMKIY